VTTEGEQPREYIITEEQLQEFFQYFKTQKDPLLAKRFGCIISDISARPVSTPPVPDSACLAEMAKTEWKNREERRGIHNREDWCCGWMAGFLSVDKPDWSKEHDAAIAQAARDKILPFVEAAKNTQSELFRNCWDKNTIELVKQIGSDLRVIEESLRRSKQEQKP
jgi:hypothetical protein